MVRVSVIGQRSKEVFPNRGMEMRTQDGGGWMTGCGDMSGSSVHWNICVAKRILMCHCWKCVNLRECVHMNVQNIKASRKVHSSISLSVNHAHSSHIDMHAPFSFTMTFVLRMVRVDSDLIFWNLGYSYNTSCSHVINSRDVSLHCASPSPPSLTCLLHLIILLNGDMKDLLFLLKESASFDRHRLLKRGVWVAAVPSLNRTSIKFWEPTETPGFWLDQW